MSRVEEYFGNDIPGSCFTLSRISQYGCFKVFAPNLIELVNTKDDGDRDITLKVAAKHIVEEVCKIRTLIQPSITQI